MAACESCGWAAAVVAMLSFGSFGVPIKSETCQRLNIDPLVFQSYKSLVCFLTAALTMWATGHEFRFTPWGIVSAIFWVPGGVATVAAVKLAGLAVAIPVGNSLIALVSFTWGIFVFREPIHSKWMACVAVGMMVLGFTGMSYFSTRTTAGEDSNKPSSVNESAEDSATPLRPLLPGREQEKLLDPYSFSGPSNIETCPSDGGSIELVEEARQKMQIIEKEIHDFEAKTFHPGAPKEQGEATEGGLRHRQVQHTVHHHSNETVHSPKAAVILSSPHLHNSPAMPISLVTTHSTNNSPHPSDTLLKLGNGMELSRRQVGIALAVFNGCWGGSIMVPMKFCPDPTITAGIGYVWSFSIGAMVVTAALWVLRYAWALADTRYSPKAAWQRMPSIHWKEMWRLGGMSGLLWSIGNLFSILSIDSLGEGVGYCVCQASMLVSGLWGIFYFQEVKGTSIIIKWFLSAFLTVSGILLLSYEHHES